MVSSKEKSGAPFLGPGQVAQQVLNFIVSEKVVTLEMIVEQFPFIRWEDLFVILGNFRREGLLTVHQGASNMELRVNRYALNMF